MSLAALMPSSHGGFGWACWLEKLSCMSPLLVDDTSTDVVDHASRRGRDKAGSIINPQRPKRTL